MVKSRYSVTYTFNGYLNGNYAQAVERVRDAVARLEREGTDIDFLGATQEINAAGQLIAMTARYAAPTKGAVGRLNCRACLPASGGPRREGTGDVEVTGDAESAARPATAEPPKH